MDGDITEWVANCTPCQESRPAPSRAPTREWEKPKGPLSRIQIDFPGPVQGHIIIDAYSKWLEVTRMTTTRAKMVIKALRRVFATHVLPDSLVFNNWAQFTAKQFELFLSEQGI